jgi:hypothetical protein
VSTEVTVNAYVNDKPTSAAEIFMCTKGKAHFDITETKAENARLCVCLNVNE